MNTQQQAIQKKSLMWCLIGACLEGVFKCTEAEDRKDKRTGERVGGWNPSENEPYVHVSCEDSKHTNKPA